jgi:hypothetical protein
MQDLVPLPSSIFKGMGLRAAATHLSRHDARARQDATGCDIAQVAADNRGERPGAPKMTHKSYSVHSIFFSVYITCMFHVHAGAWAIIFDGVPGALTSIRAR